MRKKIVPFDIIGASADDAEAPCSPIGTSLGDESQKCSLMVPAAHSSAGRSAAETKDWNRQARGRRWRRLLKWGCIVFWAVIVTAFLIMASLYLKVVFHLSWAPYVCPADEVISPGAVLEEAGAVNELPGNMTAGECSNSGPTHYILAEEHAGETFLDGWRFFTDDDPTHGVVNYVSREEAAFKNLTFYDPTRDIWILRADPWNVVNASSRGRDSVRIEAVKNYTYGLFIMEVEHIPSGCGTWPAWWMYADPWPFLGEVDIIENANSAGENNFVGHTELTCNFGSVPRGEFTGKWLPQFPWLHKDSVECDKDATGPGCAVELPKGTFGPPFNEAGGGTFAMEWDERGMRSYFWSNACSGAPRDITCRAPDPEKWGTPMSKFAFGGDCPKERFREMHMVVNQALCGDWAGGIMWARCGTRNSFMSCGSYVRDKPEAFADAYWAIKSIRVYKKKSS